MDRHLIAGSPNASNRGTGVCVLLGPSAMLQYGCSHRVDQAIPAYNLSIRQDIEHCLLTPQLLQQLSQSHCLWLHVKVLPKEFQAGLYFKNNSHIYLSHNTGWQATSYDSPFGSRSCPLLEDQNSVWDFSLIKALSSCCILSDGQTDILKRAHRIKSYQSSTGSHKPCEVIDDNDSAVKRNTMSTTAADSTLSRSAPVSPSDTLHRNSPKLYSSVSTGWDIISSFSFFRPPPPPSYRTPHFSFALVYSQSFLPIFLILLPLPILIPHLPIFLTFLYLFSSTSCPSPFPPVLISLYFHLFLLFFFLSYWPLHMFCHMSN